MKTNFLDVMKQGEWLVSHLDYYKQTYPKRAYENITPVFNAEFGLNFTKKQVYDRYRHYKERLKVGGYKFSKFNRSYNLDDLDKFFNWICSVRCANRNEWEQKWLEITGCNLSYNGITQRMFQYGYRWSGLGGAKTYSSKRAKHKVGDIVVRRNSHCGGSGGRDVDVGGVGYVNWIKVKEFSELSDSEKEIHLRFVRCLEKSPCWMRHDKYVLLRNGRRVLDDEFVVHLNGDTLDDTLSNLYVTDNYWEYCALKVKTGCIVPKLIEASLELKKTERKVKAYENM